MSCPPPQSFYIYAAELLPTSHRAVGVGLGNGLSKASAVAAPAAAIALLRAAPQAACLLALALALAASAGVLRTLRLHPRDPRRPPGPAPRWRRTASVPTEQTPL